MSSRTGSVRGDVFISQIKIVISHNAPSLLLSH
jgi:hypothetical protein